MEDNRIATTILLILASIPTGIAEIVTKPAVTEVVVGGSTYLNCSTNCRLKISWFRTQFGSSQENFIYRNDTFHPSVSGRFQMERNEANGIYNLVIPSVKIEDAGIYGCQEEIGQGSKESAQLIILESDPVCEPRLETHEIIGPNKCGIEPNQFILSCTVKYKGNEAPIMVWRRVSDGKSVSEGLTHGTIENNRVVYNLTIKGISTVKDGDSYFCNTTRSAISNYGCKSGKIKIEGADATEICKPYLSAILCIIFIILPIVIITTVLVLRKPKGKSEKLQSNASKESVNEHERHSLTSHTTSQVEDEANVETNDLKSSESSQDNIEQESSKINYPEKQRIKELQRSNTEKYGKICGLENEARIYLDNIKEQSDEIVELQGVNRALDGEIDQLKSRVKDLEQRLSPAGNIDYAEKPTLVYKIVRDAEAKDRHEPITGMTILGKELFVLHENSSMIEVYNSETFKFGRNWVMEGMSHPMDIASCKIANCLYIVFREDNQSESQIMKLEPRGQLIAKWSTGGKSGRLSTYESNVIVCLFEKQVIHEYSTDGNLIQTVHLSPAVGFNHPWHAIKVHSSHFAVCHGGAKDELHRVCIVDVQGKIIKKSGQGKSQKLKVPICLVEDSERSMLVADRGNRKIRLFNCFLKFERSLIKQDMGLDHYPVRMCLDETKERLFIAENTLSKSRNERKEGRILIFNIRKPSTTDG